MTKLSNATNAYANASKMVNPLRAVVLLYDRAIQEGLAAREAMLEGRIEDRYNHTQKAAQIVTALQGALDFENGGDISPMLHHFYNTVFQQFQNANLRNDVKSLDDALIGLNNVRRSWSELAERSVGNNEAATAPVAAAAAPVQAPSQPAPTEPRKPMTISI